MEICGKEDKLRALTDLLEPYGEIEMDVGYRIV